MKKFFRENIILFAVIAIGFVAAIIMVGSRGSVEQGDKVYDVVLDYGELAIMAEQSDMSLEEWLNTFKAMGINKVALPEESLASMRDGEDYDVEYITVAELSAKEPSWQSELPPLIGEKLRGVNIDDYDVLVTITGKEAYEFAKKGFEGRFDNSSFIFCETAKGGAMWIDGTARDAVYDAQTTHYDAEGKVLGAKSNISSSIPVYLNLGLDPHKVELIENTGMSIIPRTTAYEGWNDETFAKDVLADYGKLKAVPRYMMAAGSEVIGNDDESSALYDYIEKNNIAIGLIENSSQLKNIEQKGLDKLLEQTDYNAVRVFSMWNYIQNRYDYYGYEGAGEIENSMFRAISERNVRVIYFKPMKEKDNHKIYITNPQEYTDMFASLEKRMERYNMTMGDASPMEAYHSPMILKIICAIAAVAGAIMLLCALLPYFEKYKYILLGLGALAVVGAFFVAPNLSQLIAPLASAVVFPCLLVLMITEFCRAFMRKRQRDTKVLKILPPAIILLVLSVAGALVSAMIMCAPMSEVNFMLETDVFRGVKAAQIAPMLFFVLIFVVYFGIDRYKMQRQPLGGKLLRDVFNINIKVWMIIAGGVFAAVLMYYMGRTGHTSANVTTSMPEIMMRNALEELLLARPRNKEFLIGFPCLMMYVYACVKRLKIWSVIFGLGTVIGMTSVVNTFMHIRTPLYLGLARTGYSLFFGLLLGALGMIIFDGLHKLCVKLKGKIYPNA